MDETTPNLAPAPGGWVYENILTRVTARIEGHLLKAPLPRPSFMALELMSALKLPPEFLDGWSAANRAATAAACTPAAGACPPRLRREDGEAWWRYMTGKGALRLAWPTVDVSILDLLLFQERRTGAVVRVLVWPERFSALVIPAAADYVVVRRDPLLVRQPQQRPGLVPLPAVLEHLGAYVQRFDTPVPHWLYRGGEAHAFLIRSVRNLDARAPGEFAAVRPDQVVDA